jgi:hypothetical protein
VENQPPIVDYLPVKPREIPGLTLLTVVSLAVGAAVIVLSSNGWEIGLKDPPRDCRPYLIHPLSQSPLAYTVPAEWIFAFALIVPILWVKRRVHNARTWILVGLTLVVFGLLAIAPRIIEWVQSSAAQAPASLELYNMKREKIMALGDRAPTSAPSPREEQEMFEVVGLDPDFSFRVKAMAVLPYVPDREKAIDVLISEVRNRNPATNGDGCVQLYAAGYLAQMKAVRAIPAIADWVEYLRDHPNYGEPMRSMCLKQGQSALQQLQGLSGSTRPN